MERAELLTQPMQVLLQAHPALVALLEERGIHCGECFVADRETLAGVAIMHHIDPDELLAEWARREALSRTD
jgi:hybrid cluster-associated redox disulfide protein